jgi:hypothetical protein
MTTVFKVHILIICELIVWKMWEPQHLTTLWSTTACYRDSFADLLLLLVLLLLLFVFIYVKNY